ncbi:MAG: hypothetical protein JXA10_16140 [Anaerolineae bacterium]|nr:hypothetical protein [Anaerolineae bacterium]
MGLRKLWRNKQDQEQENDEELRSEDEVGFNIRRDEYLYWRTEEGYIIAQDVTCQYDYVQNAGCTACGHELRIAAHLNRAGQGLSELVAICPQCHTRANFIFDISNDVYQTWWESQLGSLYVRQYDGPARTPLLPE